VSTLRAITWNIFHGRDHPPEPGLHTPRSKFFGGTERGDRYAQVNRSLRAEFADALAALEWDVALLQEAPPRWLRTFCDAGAGGASALTSRNQVAALRAALAERNPDLVGPAEGGSNQVLWRPPWRQTDVRRLTLTRLPERRRMLWTELRAPSGARLCVANLHATADDVAKAGRDVLLGAKRASEWSRGAPLLFGGDLNVRPTSSPEVFELLEREYGLVGSTGPEKIDHLLSRGLAVREPPAQLPAAVREVPDPESGALVRLSDHAPVAVVFEMG
jgi:endonuclease/exonuclease/phosphatase family metal-dependent hydrolase